MTCRCGKPAEWDGLCAECVYDPDACMNFTFSASENRFLGPCGKAHLWKDGETIGTFKDGVFTLSCGCIGDPEAFGVSTEELKQQLELERLYRL